VAGGKLVVTIAAGKEEGGAGEVWIYALAKAVPVTVGRGENRGRTVTYHNVARRWQKLGEWTGKPASWNVPLSELSAGGVDTAAVIVQGGTSANPGAMLGAAITPLR
jgi:hypothetical protein